MEEYKNAELKCYMRQSKGGVYRTCKDKKTGKQVRGGEKKPAKQPRLSASTVRPRPPPPPPPSPRARLRASTVRPPPPEPSAKELADEALRAVKAALAMEDKPKLRQQLVERVKRELPDDVLKQISAFSKPTGKGRKAKPSSWTFDMWEKYWDEYLMEKERFGEWMDDMFEEWFERNYGRDDWTAEDGDIDTDFVDKVKRGWDKDVKNEILHFLVWNKGVMSGVGGDLHNKRRKKDSRSKVAKIPVNTELDGKTESELMDIIIDETY